MTIVLSYLHRLGRFCRRVERWLSTPSSAIRGSEQRYQAQFLSRLLLLIILMGTYMAFLYPLSGVSGFHVSTRDWVITIVAMVFMLGVYATSRTRHFFWSAILFIGVASSAVFLVAVPTDSDNIYMLSYLVLPVLLSSLVLPFQITAALIGLQTIGLLAFAWRYDEPMAWDWFGYVLLMSALILFGARHLTKVERKRQEYLARTERRYQTLVDTFPLGIYRTRAEVDGPVVMANPAFLQLFGIASHTELQTLRVADLYLDPAERQRFVAHLRAEGKVSHYELRLRRADGTPIWGSVTAHVTHDDETGQDYFDCTIEDITQRKQTETALHEEERRYRDLFDHSLNAFALHEIVTDDQGQPIDYVFLEANRAFEEMTGLRAADIIGKRVTEVLPGIEQTPLIQIYGQVALANAPIRFEQYVALMDQSFDIAAFSPRRGQFAVLFFDITARVKAETALREREAQYRELFEGVDDAITVHDLEGHILDVNEAACHRLGYTRDELLQMKIADLDEPGTYAEGFQERVKQQIAQGRLDGIVGAHLTKDGRRVDIESTTKVISYHGQPAILAVVRDITERKRFEKTLYYIVEQSWALSSEAFFQSLVQHLAETLGIEYAFVGELVGQKPDQKIRILAIYAQGNLVEPFEYVLRDTPCETVVGRQPCYYPEGVKDLFPKDKQLAHMGIECYMGIPLWDTEGLPLGLLTVMGRKPLSDVSLAESILQIAALRAAHEISRRHAEQQIRASEARYRAVVEDQTELILRWKPDGTRTFVNEAYCRYFGQPMEQLIGGNFMPAIIAENQVKLLARLALLTPDQPVQVGIHRSTRPDDARSVWHEWLDRAIFDENGQIVEIQSVGRDVTARVEAEDALREQRALAEALRSITSLLNSTLDPQRVFDRILSYLDRVVPHDFADIMLLENGVARLVSFRSHSAHEVNESELWAVRFTLHGALSLRMMVETGQPFIIADTHSCEEWIDIPTTRWIRSYVGVPILIGGETIGFINVNSAQPNFFTAEHVDRLQAFADQAAIAINNARSYDDLEQRVIDRTVDLSVRNAVAETLSNTLNMQQMLDGVLRTTVERLGVRGGAIYLLDENDQTLELAAHYGVSIDTLRQAMGVVPGQAIPSMSSDPLRSADTPAVLSVPIWQQRQIAGMITLVHDQPYVQQPEETRMLDAIGRQIGVALANGRLYDEAVRREARVSTILQSVADGLLVFDQNHRLILMNPAAEALFAFYPTAKGGAQKAAALLWSWLRARPGMTDTPERIEFSLPKERCMDQAELEERCALHEPSLRLMPDSDWPCWLHLGGPDETVMRQCPVYESTPRCAIHAHSANVRDAAGQTLGTVIVLHDVTRFRELDELKGRFVSTVSHELRTPLSVIMLQVSTLIKYYERLAEPQRRNMIGEIQQQTHLLRELIEDILELSRFDAKRSQPQKRWFDLLGQSQEILDALRPAIQEKRLNLEVSQQLESSYIRADPQQIVRMLRNLMSNAIKYTPEGGHIWLRMDQINGEMRLTVSDTGIGIAPEDRPRIFDRFYRATEATHMSPGTGLGLAIIKEIVDLHDGRIEVDSTVGQGSTFTVYLPVFGES